MQSHCDRLTKQTFSKWGGDYGKTKKCFCQNAREREQIGSQLDTEVSVNTSLVNGLLNIEHRQLDTRLFMWNGARVHPKGETMAQVTDSLNSQSCVIILVVIDQDYVPFSALSM